MASQKSERQLAVLVGNNPVERRGDYAHIYVKIYNTRYQDGQLEPYNRYVEDLDLENFVLTCQIDWREQQEGHSRARRLSVYGFRAEYKDASSISLRGAEAHLKWLKKLHKAIDAMPVRPTTFGQFVGLVAQGLKIETALISGDKDYQARTGQDYRRTDLAGLQFHIDHGLAKFKEEVAPGAVVEESYC